MFWAQTPRETNAHLRGIVARGRRELQVAVFAAWHVEAFARTERLPELVPLMERISGAATDGQAVDDQLAAARAIAASFGAVYEED